MKWVLIFVESLAFSLAMAAMCGSVQPNTEGHILIYGRWMRIFAIGSFGLPLLMTALVVFELDPSDKNPSFVLPVAFFCLAVVLYLEIFRVQIRYDDEGIRTESPWRRKRHVRWGELLRVFYTPSYQWYEVETRTQGHIRVPILMDGVQTFLAELDKRGFVIERPGKGASK